MISRGIIDPAFEDWKKKFRLRLPCTDETDREFRRIADGQGTDDLESIRLDPRLKYNPNAELHARNAENALHIASLLAVGEALARGVILDRIHLEAVVECRHMIIAEEIILTSAEIVEEGLSAVKPETVANTLGGRQDLVLEKLRRLCGPENKWVSHSKWVENVKYNVRDEADRERLIAGLAGTGGPVEKRSSKAKPNAPAKGPGSAPRHYRLAKPLGAAEWTAQFGLRKKGSKGASMG
jgi:hypothetical protein